jgi:hypothetical protein
MRLGIDVPEVALRWRSHGVGRGRRGVPWAVNHFQAGQPFEHGLFDSILADSLHANASIKAT